MAGKKQNSGRPKKLGRVYYLGRYRFVPGLDPPELETVLQAIAAANDEQRRRDILRAALLSGAGEAQQAASAVESSLTAGTVDDMFDAF